MCFLSHTYFMITQVLSYFRPTARRKPGPVSDTIEAQKKFGDVKSISSDMYFGKQDKSEVSITIYILPYLHLCILSL